MGRECDITQLIEIKKGERGRAKAKAANKTGQGKARQGRAGQSPRAPSRSVLPLRSDRDRDEQEHAQLSCSRSCAAALAAQVFPPHPWTICAEPLAFAVGPLVGAETKGGGDMPSLARDRERDSMLNSASSFSHFRRLTSRQKTSEGGGAARYPCSVRAVRRVSSFDVALLA